MTRLPDPRLRPPDGGTLIDTYGRVARDLRVSVTDRCSFRCTYCMPADGLPWLPSAELLSDEELVRVVRVFVGLGVTQVRLTGGEPLAQRQAIPLMERRCCGPASSTWSRLSQRSPRGRRWR